MTKKFEVSFSSTTALSPSIVYVSPSEGYSGHFAVGILHPINSSGTFQSSAGIAKTFDLKQNLTSSEEEAINWATNWLSQKSGCSASLREVAA
ncbi:hypothetical protein [Methylobacter sp.]|uniref:hypothetical protein n=1 Tax=Methylobacter sp. TaxID=2051955 RepID=UPI002FDE758D